MPVRSLSSSVLKWPDAAEVWRRLREWAVRQADIHSGLLAVGCIGSCARGAWGVGSDVDIVAVVQASALPFAARGREWDVTDWPVPADLLIYTAEEWRGMDPDSRFGRVLGHEAVWVYGAPPPLGQAQCGKRPETG